MFWLIFSNSKDEKKGNSCILSFLLLLLLAALHERGPRIQLALASHRDFLPLFPCCRALYYPRAKCRSRTRHEPRESEQGAMKVWCWSQFWEEVKKKKSVIKRTLFAVRAVASVLWGQTKAYRFAALSQHRSHARRTIMWINEPAPVRVLDQPSDVGPFTAPCDHTAASPRAPCRTLSRHLESYSGDGIRPTRSALNPHAALLYLRNI